MKKGKLGFTIIEVAIFLAITGLLFLGVTIGVQNSINKQRENDALQSFMEFLRGVYSQVENVQNTKATEDGIPIGGKSEQQAIYGKMVTFGEKDNEIFVYTVLGNVVEADSNISGGTGLGAWSGLTVFEASTDANTKPEFAGSTESYTPKWDTRIERSGDHELFKGTILVLRHPVSGIINTFYSPDVEKIQEVVSSTNFSLNGSFKPDQIDFCVNTSNSTSGGFRSDVRIVTGAANASAIELVPEEQSECQ